MFIIKFSDGGPEDYFETSCFVVRDECRAREIVAEANEQLVRARSVRRPTWNIEVRDFGADIVEWETKRRAIMTIWPRAWNVEGDCEEFFYEPIEERN
jgi:hypothetical protein